jgi:hypothetical protein
MRSLLIFPPIHEDAALAAAYARSVRALRQQVTFQSARPQFQRIFTAKTGPTILSRPPAENTLTSPKLLGAADSFSLTIQNA